MQCKGGGRAFGPSGLGKCYGLYNLPGQPLRHLCTACDTPALGDELHCLFDCPHSSSIRAQFPSLFQDAAACIRMFKWHNDQKPVSQCSMNCPAAKGPDLHKPSWLKGRRISVFVSLLICFKQTRHSAMRRLDEKLGKRLSGCESPGCAPRGARC